MDLFYKKRYEELQRSFHSTLENQKKSFEEQLNRNQDWLKDLLFEKNNLEKNIAKLETELKASNNTNAVLKLSLNEVSNKLKKLSARNIELNSASKSLRAKLGGSQKEINKLREELGMSVLKIQLMGEQLKKFRIKPPTIKELMEYERTHKSPKNRKEKQNV